VESQGPYDFEAPTGALAPKARSSFYHFTNGGPSQVDLFDFKLTLSKFAGSAQS
jgi:hypothetical protein